jgi:hypothetical protein
VDELDVSQKMNFKAKRIYATTVGFTALIIAIFLLVSKRSRRSLDRLGSIHSPKIAATLSFTKANPGIFIERRVSGFDWGIVKYGMTTSISPQGWTNYPGFFATIDDEGRFWAYNGKDQTWIYERMSDGGVRTFGLQTWKGAVPPEFSKKIPVNSPARGINKNG